MVHPNSFRRYDERARMLVTFDRVVPSIPARPVEEVEAELEEVRQARRGGGRVSERGVPE